MSAAFNFPVTLFSLRDRYYAVATRSVGALRPADRIGPGCPNLLKLIATMPVHAGAALSTI